MPLCSRVSAQAHVMQCTGYSCMLRGLIWSCAVQTGYDIILNTTGRDATEDFEEIGHSNAAREMLDKYLVGNFEVTP